MNLYITIAIIAFFGAVACIIQLPYYVVAFLFGLIIGISFRGYK